MVKTQYAFATSSVAPFQRMVLFSDGEGTVLGDFPFTLNPTGLRNSDFSPDSSYLIAATVNASTTPLRLWRLRGHGDFEEIDLPAQASAKTITGLRWITDTHIAFTCFNTGMWFGVLDRATNTITWTNPSTFKFVGLSVTPDSTYIIGLRDGTNGAQWFLRTGNTLATTSGNFNLSNFLWTQGEFLKSGQAWIGCVSNAAANDAHYRRRTAVTGLDATGMTTTALDISMGCRAVRPSRDGDLVYIASAFAPYLRSTKLINTVPNTSIRWIGNTPTNDNATFPGVINALAEINLTPRNIVLVAVASSSQTTGRVRGFYYDAVTMVYTEIPAIAAMFNDWNCAIEYISTSTFVGDGRATQMYNGATKWLLDNVDTLSNLKLALVKSSGVFDKTHTNISSVLGANEAYGSTWPQGGIDVTSVTLGDGLTAGGASLKLSIPAFDLRDPGTFPFRSAVLYHATTSKPLAFLMFSEEKSVKQYDRIEFTSPSGRLVLIEPA